MAKVVHVTSVHPALDNRILFKECRSLARAGHDVVLVAPHDAHEVVDGVRIRAFPRARGRLARMTRGVRDALRLCRDERADVYHAHDPELMPGLARLARGGARARGSRASRGPAGLGAASDHFSCARIPR